MSIDFADTEPDCSYPLPDGSPCHACRIFQAVVDAEISIDPDSVRAGVVDCGRIVESLGAVMASFLTEMTEDEVDKVFVWIKQERVEQKQKMDTEEAKRETKN